MAMAMLDIFRGAIDMREIVIACSVEVHIIEI
jgi:hypothetical protein